MIDPYQWQDRLENAITHSVHAVYSPASRSHAEPIGSSSLAYVSAQATGANNVLDHASSLKRELPSSNVAAPQPVWAPTGIEHSVANTRRRLEGNPASGSSVEHGTLCCQLSNLNIIQAIV